MSADRCAHVPDARCQVGTSARRLAVRRSIGTWHLAPGTRPEGAIRHLWMASPEKGADTLERALLQERLPVRLSQ